MPKLPVLCENVNILPVASWCRLVSHAWGKPALSLLNPARKSTVSSTVTSYSDTVYYRTYLRDAVVTNGHYNKMVHHLTLPETLCVTCSVTMLLSLSQTCGHPANSPDLNPADYAVGRGCNQRRKGTWEGPDTKCIQGREERGDHPGCHTRVGN